MCLKVCLFTYNVFCNAALRMFYRCNMAALKADVSFYGLDIYISSFYLGRFVYFLDGYLSLFVLLFSLIWCSLQLEVYYRWRGREKDM